MEHRRLVLVCLVVCCLGLGLCQDYDERPAPRGRLPPRGPLASQRAPKQPTQKTSTTEAAPLEEELEYEEEPLEEEPQTTTSTEPPRKGIRGGVVRPFRSNTDLLEALKRRRAQVQSGAVAQSTAAPSTSTTGQSAEAGGRQGRKGKWNRSGSSTTEQAPAEEQPRQRAQFARGRRF